MCAFVGAFEGQMRRRFDGDEEGGHGEGDEVGSEVGGGAEGWGYSRDGRSETLEARGAGERGVERGDVLDEDRGAVGGPWGEQGVDG